MACPKIANWSLWMTMQGPITQDHKIQIQITQYKVTQPPLIPMGTSKGVLYSLQYHNSFNVDPGSFINSLLVTLTNKQQGCEHDLPPPITLTIPRSYQSIVEVETLLTLCTSAGSMILLVLQTMTQLSAHLAKQMHFLYSFTVVPWWPFVQEQKLIPYCTATIH